VTCVSGSQRTAALAAAGRYDRPAGAGAHAQPKSVNPGPAPIVRLEGPFALGHGGLSSSHLAARPRGGADTHPRISNPHSFKLCKKRRGPDNRSLPCRRCLTTPRGYLGHLRRSNHDDWAGQFQFCLRHVHRLAPVGKPVSFLPARKVRFSQQPDYLPPDKKRRYAATNGTPGPVHTCG
jgi:hypothetical protein